MPVGRDLPSHFRAGSQHTFEFFEKLVALGILHAITYSYFGVVFLVINWIHNNHLYNVINKGFLAMLVGI